MGANLSELKITSGEEYTRTFRETFSDVKFTGMKLDDTIKLLKSRGFEKYKIWPYGTPYVTKLLRKEVIIYTDKDMMFVTGECEYC